MELNRNSPKYKFELTRKQELKDGEVVSDVVVITRQRLAVDYMSGHGMFYYEAKSTFNIPTSELLILNKAIEEKMAELLP